MPDWGAPRIDWAWVGCCERQGHKLTFRFTGIRSAASADTGIWCYCLCPRGYLSMADTSTGNRLQCLHLIAVCSAASADTGSWMWCLYLCGCGIVSGCTGTLSAASTDTGGTCLFTVTQGGFVSLRRSEVLNYFSEGLHLFGHGLIGLHQGGQQHLGVIPLANLLRCVGRLSPCFFTDQARRRLPFPRWRFFGSWGFVLGHDWLSETHTVTIFFFLNLLTYLIFYWLLNKVKNHSCGFHVIAGVKPIYNSRRGVTRKIVAPPWSPPKKQNYAYCIQLTSCMQGVG